MKVAISDRIEKGLHDSDAEKWEKEPPVPFSLPLKYNDMPDWRMGGGGGFWQCEILY